MTGELERQFARVYRVSLDRYRHTRDVPLALFRKGVVRTRRRTRPLPMCPVAGRRHLVVDVDGQVYGCVAFAESYQRFPTPMLRERMARLRMGDVRAPDLAERLARYQEAARATDILTAKEDQAACPISHVPSPAPRRRSSRGSRGNDRGRPGARPREAARRHPQAAGRAHAARLTGGFAVPSGRPGPAPVDRQAPALE